MKNWIYIGVLLLCLPITACKKNSTPPSVTLNDAIVMRDNAAVKAHLAIGTDVNAADSLGITPLIAAATSGQLDVVKLLLAAGADINIIGMNDNTALIYTIQAEQTDIALFLIDQKGINLNARDSHGSNALVEAIVYDQLTIAELLLEKGVDINALGPANQTALHIAATSLDFEKIIWLIDRNADPNAVAAYDVLPLHNAAIFSMPEDPYNDQESRKALQLLLDSTSNINATNSNNRTPLHKAVEWADLWLIQVLLNAGTDPLVMDQLGFSQVCYSRGSERTRLRTQAETLSIIELFKKNGLTDESIIDKHGTTLKVFEEQLKDRP